MQQKIKDFFNSEGLNKLKQITTNELLYALSNQKIATNSGDAYYFIRICKGMGVLKQIKPKNFEIDREKLKKEGVNNG